MALEDEPSEDEAIAGPGEYEFTWRRSVPLPRHPPRHSPRRRVLPNGEYGSLNTSRFPLPALRPPRDGLIALLDLPASARLHTPTSARLTVRNRHTTRTASVIVLVEPDPADAFVVAGVRAARLPALLPGAEEHVVWTLVALECGLVRPPKIRVVDRRRARASAGSAADGAQQGQAEEEGFPVKIVDVRREARGEDGVETASGESETGAIGTILVLP
jgi:trafficking protein particle complex subunit 11